MNKNTVTKVVKKIVIGGVVYLMADFCYQMGKGAILGRQMKHEIDAKEAYGLLTKDGMTKMETIRCKIIKHFADSNMERA